MMHSDDTEEWRPVTCAPEFYEVSNFGRVRRAMYSVPVLNGSTRPGRLLKTDRGAAAPYDFVILSRR
ncbi:MAG TPA: NUMOD4 domain-containing protein, partial [Chloroflexota bacterium]|nr:NUMOD4 domain-containing protein [Chloroflexota bacterium]